MYPRTQEQLRCDKIWEKLVDEGIATDEECRLVTEICGYTEKALYDILYSRTGYRNFEQMEDEL